MKALTAYEMDNIGVGGALEAVAAFHFCSPECRIEWATNVSDMYAYGTDSDTEIMSGEVCEQCGRVLSPENGQN